MALLGSVLAAAYTSRLDLGGQHLAGRPGPVAAAARDSVAGAMQVAGQLGDAALALNARAAYVHAMDVVLVSCAALAVVGAGLVAWRMPARPMRVEGTEESGHELTRVA